MEISAKIYKRDITKTYFKTNNLFFIYNGINRNSIDKLIADQNIKSTNFKYKKIRNKTVNVAIKKSIYCSISSVIAGVSFFINTNTPYQVLDKKVLVNKLRTFFFFLSAVKINNKLYSTRIVRNINFFNYIDNNLLFFQSIIVSLKLFSKKLKKSK